MSPIGLREHLLALRVPFEGMEFDPDDFIGREVILVLGYPEKGAYKDRFSVLIVLPPED